MHGLTFICFYKYKDTKAGNVLRWRQNGNSKIVYVGIRDLSRMLPLSSEWREGFGSGLSAG